MAEVIKVYRQSVPALRFVGKKYGDADRVDGGFGAQWHEWMRDGLFGFLGEKCGPVPMYEDSATTIGLMRWKEGEPFQYWIGIFFAENTVVPRGYDCVDFPASDLGVAWLSGEPGGVFGQEDKCAASCTKAGYKLKAAPDGAWWFFERYAESRFAAPDEKGNIILDICHYIEKA